MPRANRKQSEGDLYHVVQRGAGQQVIFEDDQDREVYLALLPRFADALGVASPVLAWCLMSNHVHLLVRMPLLKLSEFMRLVGIAYARYFNDRHARVGHLFQDRFKSEPIDSDEYLMLVVRYIHANPVGLECQKMDSYRWSSYREYVGKANTAVASTSFVLDVFGGQSAFEEFHRLPGQAETIIDADQASSRPRNDEQALALAKQVLEGMDIYDLKSANKAERDCLIVRLRDAGLSVRQIARLSGIGTNIVARARIPGNLGQE